MTVKKYSTAIFAALLSALVLAVYWQTVGFELINLDDLEYTAFNPLVNGGLTVEGIKAAFTQSWGKYWIPVTWVSYMADVSISGLSPEGFHRTNVILHLFNVLLLFSLFSAATGSCWKSFFVAALWAVHPLRAESVAWVTERKDVLSGFFFLLALWSHIEFARSEKKQWLAAITIFALLGLMAKPVVMVLPVALLLLDFWPLDRFPKGNPGENLPACKRLLLEKAHLFVLSAVFVFITVKTQRIEGSFHVDLAEQRVNLPGIHDNFATAVKAYYAYAFETFWPVGLYLRGNEYDLTLDIPITVLCLAVLIMVSVFAFKCRKSFPELAFGWFWYLLILFPTSGIVKAGIISTFADRFTYLPHIGLMVALVCGVERLYNHYATDLRLLAATGVAIIAVFSVLCFRQVSFWRDDFILFNYVDKMSGERSATAKKSLGTALYNKGKYQEAYDFYSMALQLEPGIKQVKGFKGYAAAMLGRNDEAAALYRMELDASPGDKEFSIRLANVLITLGDSSGAARQALLNIHLWPGDSEAWDAVNRLGGEARAREIAGR